MINVNRQDNTVDNALSRRALQSVDVESSVFVPTNKKTPSINGRSPSLITEIEYNREIALANELYDMEDF